MQLCCLSFWPFFNVELDKCSGTGVVANERPNRICRAQVVPVNLPISISLASVVWSGKKIPKRVDHTTAPGRGKDCLILT